MIRKTIALTAIGSVLLFAAIGISTEAQSVPCSVHGTNPGGHEISFTVGSNAIQNVMDRMAHAGWTDLTFDCR